MSRAARRGAIWFGTALVIATTLGGGAQATSPIQVQGTPNPGDTTESRVMRFGDLDLTNEAGRARLENRLKVAAGTVCGKRSLWTVRPPADYEVCYDRALSAARRQLGERLAAGETSIRLVSN